MEQSLGVNQSTKRIAVISGANKGIGLAICRQLASNGNTVILTSRDEKNGVEAVQSLKKEASSALSDIIFHQLDVTNQTSISSLAAFIKNEFGKLDILVNNAAIAGSIIAEEDIKSLKMGYDDIVGPNEKLQKNIVKQNRQVAEAALGTNYHGVKFLTQELIPLLQLSDSPRIVNVSSTMGQLKVISNEKAKKELSDIETLSVEKVDQVVEEFLQDLEEDLLETKGWPIIFSPYKVSKIALNAYTRILAKKYPDIAVNAVSPGFVKTDLNHHAGILTTEQGAKGPVLLALLPHGGPSGLFYDRMEVSTF